jgi:multiple sugar transport system ATP-binding protein
MNFLPAAAVEGGWQVAGQLYQGPRASGLEFGIRPEDVEPADAGFSGEVRVIEPLGAHQLVTMNIAGQLFRAVLDSDRRVSLGETLTLAPRPDRVRWFDSETGLAVAA